MTVEEFFYKWTVSLSQFARMQFGGYVASKKFITVKNNVSFTWCLKLYPKGLRQEKIDTPDRCLVLSYIDGPRECVLLTAEQSDGYDSVFRASIGERIQASTECKKTDDSMPSSRINSNVFETDPNQSPTRTFVVRFQVESSVFNVISLIPALPEIQASIMDQLLAQVLDADSDPNSEFSIQTEDDHIYAIDRRVLSTRSDYFKQFFREGSEIWNENASRIIRAPFRKQAMDEILTYIYTGRVNIPMTRENVIDVKLMQELVICADHYLLPELTKHYERPLISDLLANQSGISALALFVLADRHGLSILKNVSLSVLNDQYDSIEELRNSIELKRKAGIVNEEENAEEEEFTALFEAFKISNDDHSSLIDELIFFSRHCSATNCEKYL